MNIPYASSWMKIIMKGIERYAPRMPHRSWSLMSTSVKYSLKATKHKNARLIEDTDWVDFFCNNTLFLDIIHEEFGLTLAGGNSLEGGNLLFNFTAFTFRALESFFLIFRNFYDQGKRLFTFFTNEFICRHSTISFYLWNFLILKDKCLKWSLVFI